jgi:hypothetical protein
MFSSNMRFTSPRTSSGSFVSSFDAFAASFCSLTSRVAARFSISVTSAGSPLVSIFSRTMRNAVIALAFDTVGPNSTAIRESVGAGGSSCWRIS